MKKIILATSIALICCTKQPNTDVNVDLTNDSINSIQLSEKDFSVLESFIESKDITDTALVQVIDYPCAVFTIPDSLQIEQMKKEYGEEDFYTVADDINWYNYTASEMLDSLNIRKVDVSKKYIRFKGDKGSVTLNLGQQHSPGWNLFFFNPEKSPEIISTVDTTPEKIKSYFSN